MRRVTSRLALFAVLAASVLGFAAVGATAKTGPTPTKPKPSKVVIKGGTTTITATTATVKFLTSHKIGVVAVAPAKLSGTSLTLPVKGGFALPKSLNGVLLHTGKLEYTFGKKSVTLRHITLYKAGKKAHLAAIVRGTLINLGSISNLKASLSSKTKTATVTGELHLSGASAHLINKLAGKQLVKAGYDFGSVSSTLTIK